MFNKFRFNNKREGSITLETTLLFPLIMFIFFSLIYLTIVLYQDTIMVAESIRAVNRAGAYWKYIDVDSTGKQGEGIVPPPFNPDIEAKDIITKEMVSERNAYAPVIDVFPLMLSLDAYKGELFGYTFGLKNDYAGQYVDTRIKNLKFKQYLESGNESKSQYYEVQDGGFVNTFQNMFLRREIKVGVNRIYNNVLKGANGRLLGEKSIDIMEEDKKEDIIVRGVVSSQVDYKRNFDAIYGLAGYTYDQLDEIESFEFDPVDYVKKRLTDIVADKVKNLELAAINAAAEKGKEVLQDIESKRKLKEKEKELEKKSKELDEKIKKAYEDYGNAGEMQTPYIEYDENIKFNLDNIEKNKKASQDRINTLNMKIAQRQRDGEGIQDLLIELDNENEIQFKLDRASKENEVLRLKFNSDKARLFYEIQILEAQKDQIVEAQKRVQNATTIETEIQEGITYNEKIISKYEEKIKFNREQIVYTELWLVQKTVLEDQAQIQSSNKGLEDKKERLENEIERKKVRGEDISDLLEQKDEFKTKILENDDKLADIRLRIENWRIENQKLEIENELYWQEVDRLAKEIEEQRALLTQTN